MPFEIIRNDITRVKADAIVNTANPRPVIGSGTDTAIHMAAGPELLEARKRVGDIAEGDSAQTPAFGLNAKYVIHTVTTGWIDGEHGEEDILKKAYGSALSLADKLGCKSVAFPLLSTGSYGFPKELAMSVAIQVFTDFLMSHDMRIILAVFNKEAYSLAGSLFDDVRSYVDDNYVENAVVDEYGLTDEDWRDMSTIRRRRERYFHGASNRPLSRGEQAKLDAIYDDAAKPFSVKVFELADKKGIKCSKLYGPNERYFSKQVISAMQKNSNYHPAKFVAVTICIVLELDLDETLDLLERAGYTLSRSRKADVVIRACIENGIRDYEKIDKKLEENGCEELRKLK